MIITPTLETLRFMGSRIAEIHRDLPGNEIHSSSKDISATVSLIAQVYARQLVELVPVLHEAGQTLLALEVALAVPLPSLRCAALQYLGRLGQGNRPVLIEAFRTLKQIKSERERIEALIQLAPDLPLDLLSEAIELARQLTWTYARVKVLNILAQQCVEPDERHMLMKEAFDTALQIDDAQEAAEAIIEIMPEMNWQDVDAAIRELLEMIDRIRSESVRATIFAVLVDQLYTWLNTNSVPISTLVPYLTRFNKIAQEAFLTQIFQDQALYAVGPLIGIQDPILLYIPPSLLRRAIAELKMVAGKGNWVQAIIDLLPLLENDPSEQHHVPDYALVSSIPNPIDAPHQLAIKRFTARIPSDMTPDILGLILHLPTPEDQAEVLIGLIPRLPEQNFEEALTLIYQLSESIQCEIFTRLAPTLNHSFAQRAITHLKTLPSSPEQIHALTALADADT